MKTLIIDNYDSFTFNLYQMVAEVNGELPLVIRNDQIAWETLRDIDCDNIIISPGPGHPCNRRDFGVCRQVLLASDMPLLGVCLGHQGLAAVYGGAVHRAPQVMHGRRSQVYHCGSALFRGLPSPFAAVRYHSLVVDDPLPTPLHKIAWTADGVIMGLQHQEKPFWGVQFHPESICTEYGQQLLQNFRLLTDEFRGCRPGRKRVAVRWPEALSVVPVGRPTPEVSPTYQVHYRQLDFFRDADDAFMALYAAAPVAFWLDSSLVEPGLSRFSFMGDASGPHSFCVTYQVARGELTVSSNGTSTSHSGNIFDFLAHELDRRCCHCEALPFDFDCGFVGYFGYELKAEGGARNAHTSALPDAMFVLADRLLAFDHQENVLYLVCLTAHDAAEEALAWFDQMEERLRTLATASEVVSESRQEPIAFQWSRSQDQYRCDIAACFDEINRGESYEICLTNRLSTDYRPDPMTFYRILRRHNPAPYAAFLRFGEIAVACSSPERFLRIDRDRWVESKPIKGTCKRGETSEEDARLKELLRCSEKDRAENLMIVDLLRNDIGTVCEVSTVHVPKLMDIETYATVHQMVSTVKGRLRAEMRAVDCVRMAFPGGSMTGAPKQRTMEIIDRLERTARGIYSGCIGFLALNNTVDLNIVIRTAVISATDMSIGAGGAIVALSQPEAECEEVLLKTRALVEAILLTAYGCVDDVPYAGRSTVVAHGHGAPQHQGL